MEINLVCVEKNPVNMEKFIAWIRGGSAIRKQEERQSEARNTKGERC
jgi:hypothetical protein